MQSCLILNFCPEKGSRMLRPHGKVFVCEYFLGPSSVVDFLFFQGKLSPNSVVLKPYVLMPFSQRKIILKSLIFTFLLLFLHSLLEYVLMLQMRVIKPFPFVSIVAPGLVPLRMVHINTSKLLVWNITTVNEAVIFFQVSLDLKKQGGSSLIAFFYIFEDYYHTQPSVVVFYKFSSLGSYSMFDCIPLTTLKLAYPFKCGTPKKTDYSGLYLTNSEKSRI